MSRIHLIAIGGSVMHNLALALQAAGHQVTGSDDQIFEPAKTRLQSAGLCPVKEGWDDGKISTEIDLVILGMHAKKNNPELLKAQELSLSIVSFPEYMSKLYAHKMQIVVCGSHGKTTTTSMIMQVFNYLHRDFDYLVGAQLEGFDHMVKISDAPVAIIEGDEYLCSCVDMTSKFHYYQPNICIITGLAWDHFNVFPSYQSYLDTFIRLVKNLKQNSYLLYYDHDAELVSMCKEFGGHLNLIPYTEAPHSIRFGNVYLESQHASVPISVFGDHNLQNIAAVKEVFEILDVHYHQVSLALQNFKGASKRLEEISSANHKMVYLDFAHAPSKVKATINAVRKKYMSKKLSVVVELHTYSSLNKDFLPQYAHSLDDADEALIYFDSKALEIKKMEPLDKETITKSFRRNDVSIVSQSDELLEHILEMYESTDVLLFLGSGNFGGHDPRNLFPKY